MYNIKQSINKETNKQLKPIHVNNMQHNKQQVQPTFLIAVSKASERANALANPGERTHYAGTRFPARPLLNQFARWRLKFRDSSSTLYSQAMVLQGTLHEVQSAASDIAICATLRTCDALTQKTSKYGLQ